MASKKKYTPITVGGFVIDAVLSEGHSYTAQVTQNPVESGSTISDHVELDPVSLTLDCCVSDTPMEPIAALRNIVTAALSSLGSDVVWSEQAFSFFVYLWRKRDRITVVTPLVTYDDMVIESYTVPRKSDDGGALLFQLSLKQLRIVKNDRAVVRVATPKVAGKQNRGTLPTVPSAPNATRLAVRERNAAAERARRDELSWGGETLDNLLPGNFLTNP